MSPQQKEQMFAGSEYAHTLEMVSAAISGAISTDPQSVEAFNLWGYEYKCAEMDSVGKRGRAKKELHIVEFTTSSDDDLQVGYGEISARDLGSEDEMLSALEDSMTFEDNIRHLFNIRSKYISERGVDVVSVLYNALSGIPDAIAQMKTLVKDSTLRELYTQLCEESSGVLVQRLEVAVT